MHACMQLWRCACYQGDDCSCMPWLKQLGIAWGCLCVFRTISVCNYCVHARSSTVCILIFFMYTVVVQVIYWVRSDRPTVDRVIKSKLGRWSWTRIWVKLTVRWPYPGEWLSTQPHQTLPSSQFPLALGMLMRCQKSILIPISTLCSILTHNNALYTSSEY